MVELELELELVVLYSYEVRVLRGTVLYCSDGVDHPGARGYEMDNFTVLYGTRTGGEYILCVRGEGLWIRTRYG